jgi:hypothetical protein
MKRVLLATLATTTLMIGAAQAQMATALVGADQLVTFDAKTGKRMQSIRVTGAPGGIAGIDVRPADGQLYVLANDGTVLTVDPTSGAVTMKSKLEKMLPAGTQATVDFNPVADRLRVMGSDGTNLRANVDDGKVAVDGTLNFKADDKMAGKTPKIVAGAYSNSFKGTKETALYDIDASGTYLKQAPPNDGILNTLGKVGPKADRIAFDILSDGQNNWGFAVTGKTLSRIDIATGKLTKVAELQGLNGQPVRDIAVWAK